MTMMVCMTLMCNIGDTEKSGEFTDGVVGLERTFYRVMEDVGVVEVCAIVYRPDRGNTCPITFPFAVRLSTTDDTAGNLLS